jgi:hypothetical protein
VRRIPPQALQGISPTKVAGGTNAACARTSGAGRGAGDGAGCLAAQEATPIPMSKAMAPPLMLCVHRPILACSFDFIAAGLMMP